MASLAREEAKLQPRYEGLLYGSGAPRARAEVLEVLENSATLLELAAFGALFHELAGEFGCETWEDVAAIEAFEEALSRRVPFDIGGVVRRVLSAEELARMETPRGQLFPQAALVRSAAGLTGSCPIEELEQAAAEHGVPERGYRCRISYDALRAFLARHGDDRLRILGRVYAEGGMSVEEVAKVMRIAVEDAAALLQEHGFARSMETWRLDEAERERAYAAMRADRLARYDEPVARDDEDARRDTIASARIEDVDARPWLRRSR